jgi:hypothetical protein
MKFLRILLIQFIKLFFCWIWQEGKVVCSWQWKPCGESIRDIDKKNPNNTREGSFNGTVYW